MRLRARDSLVAPRHSIASIAVVAALSTVACSDPDRERLKATTKATYDRQTGRLAELTFDSNKNGKIDTWTEMDGNRAVRSRLDRDEDGRIDRWEYYDAAGQVTKVGFSRKGDGKPDAWAYSNGRGRIVRIEASTTGDEQKIDRWEFYDALGPQGPDGTGALARVMQDTNGDGKPDKWEHYKAGELVAAEFDENSDQRPDRRLTYRDAQLVAIETAPDGRGGYARKVTPQ